MLQVDNQLRQSQLEFVSAGLTFPTTTATTTTTKAAGQSIIK
jgi:hypothetical protein